MNFSALKSAITFKMSRSSGSGGQHVNKVATKVELLFDLWSTTGLTYEEKNLIQQKLSNRISQEGLIRVVCQDTRSQLKNREKAVEKFLKLIEGALTIPKERKRKKKPTKKEKERRLKMKKQRSEKKANRKKVKFNKESDLFSS